MARRRQANELLSPGTKWPKWDRVAEVLACPSPGVDQGLQEKGQIWETEHRFSVLHLDYSVVWSASACAQIQRRLSPAWNRPEERGVTALGRSPPWVFHMTRCSVSYLTGYESELRHFWLQTWLCTSNCVLVSSSGNGGKNKIPLVGSPEDQGARSVQPQFSSVAEREHLCAGWGHLHFSAGCVRGPWLKSTAREAKEVDRFWNYSWWGRG